MKQELYKSLVDTFRYEECYRDLCRPIERFPQDAKLRDLLLDRIGHISLCGDPREVLSIRDHLERYVNDPRQSQNEKFLNKDRVNNPENGSQVDSSRKFFRINGGITLT